MHALDTNVLVRYLAQDDAKQSAAATRLLEERLTRADRGFVSLVVVLETVWVMESRYGADAATISDILQDLLQADACRKPPLCVMPCSATARVASTCTTASSSRWRPRARLAC